MTLLAVTSDTWIVTGLGFGIVLALLFCLVFIMMLFGYLMQKVTKPAASSAQPKAQKPMAPKTDEAEIAAVAYALYLNEQTKSDPNISMITLNKRETAWNPKSNGFNNIGF